MNEKVYSINEIKTLLHPVFQGYGVTRAILFGSYGKGQATPKSDVDILVDSGLKGLRFVGLISDIKSSLQDKDVDVIDVSHIEHNSPVESEIKRNGVVIYTRGDQKGGVQNACWH